MRRQVIIGGVVGIALGGLITFSVAHGVVTWGQGGGTTAPQRAADPDSGMGEADTSAPEAPRPLRPGSGRLGRNATSAPDAVQPEPARRLAVGDDVVAQHEPPRATMIPSV